MPIDIQTIQSTMPATVYENVKVTFSNDKSKPNSLKLASKRVWHKNFDFVNTKLKEEIKKGWREV